LQQKASQRRLKLAGRSFRNNPGGLVCAERWGCGDQAARGVVLESPSGFASGCASRSVIGFGGHGASAPRSAESPRGKTGSLGWQVVAQTGVSGMSRDLRRAPLPCTSPRGKTDRFVLVGGARHDVREDVWFGGGAAASCKAAAATVRLGCGSEPLGSSAAVATCQVVPRWRLEPPDSLPAGRRPRWPPEIPWAPEALSSSSLTQAWIRRASLLEGCGTLPSSLREWQRSWLSDRLV